MNIPESNVIEITEEQYKQLIPEYDGVIAHRRREGKIEIKLLWYCDVKRIESILNTKLTWN